VLWKAAPQKRVAILVPTWKEGTLLKSMIETNTARLQYQNYFWVLGVYPNDIDTLEVARSLEAAQPEKILVVLMDRGGPTFKAHCLNGMLAHLRELAQTDQKFLPEYVMVQGSEDILDPQALVAINGQPANTDLMQFPIVSISVPVKNWFDGSYLTNEYVNRKVSSFGLRQIFGMPIRTVGYQNVFSWKVLTQLHFTFGQVFEDKANADNDELLVKVSQLGGWQRSLLMKNEAGTLLVTKEYYPIELGRSVRQKTRWITGAATYSCPERTFSYLRRAVTSYLSRCERVTLSSNNSVLLTWMIGITATVIISFSARNSHLVASALHNNVIIQSLIGLNLFLFGMKIYQRILFCASTFSEAGKR
jgi:adsorption protein B